jgi:hypothetical protein
MRRNFVQTDLELEDNLVSLARSARQKDAQDLKRFDDRSEDGKQEHLYLVTNFTSFGIRFERGPRGLGVFRTHLRYSTSPRAKITNGLLFAQSSPKRFSRSRLAE